MSSDLAISVRNLGKSPVSPAPQGRLGAIDGMRALAMLMVYAYHVWLFGEHPALNVSLHGHSFSVGNVFASFPAGVDLFMVLSGFCLFWPLCKSPSGLAKWTWNDYAHRRIRRIVPPYYAAIVYVTLLPIVLVVFYRLLHQPAKWQRVPSVAQFATHLAFVHTLFPSTWDGIQGAFWSLGLEAQFYVAFPLVIWGYRRMGIKVAWWMIALSVAYRLGTGYLVNAKPWPEPFLFSVFFLGRWMQFAAGMLAAWFVAQRVRDGRFLGGWAGTLAMLAALGMYSLTSVMRSDNQTLFPTRDMLLAGAFALSMIALCVSRTPVRVLFENRVVVWLGFISYSIFLIHQNTVYYFGELLKKGMHLGGATRFTFMMTVGFALVVGLSYVFFLAFERPFLNHRPRRSVEIAPAPELELVPV